LDELLLAVCGSVGIESAVLAPVLFFPSAFGTEEFCAILVARCSGSLISACCLSPDFSAELNPCRWLVAVRADSALGEAALCGAPPLTVRSSGRVGTPFCPSPLADEAWFVARFAGGSANGGVSMGALITGDFVADASATGSLAKGRFLAALGVVDVASVFDILFAAVLLASECESAGLDASGELDTCVELAAASDGRLALDATEVAADEALRLAPLLLLSDWLLFWDAEFAGVAAWLFADAVLPVWICSVVVVVSRVRSVLSGLSPAGARSFSIVGVSALASRSVGPDCGDVFPSAADAVDGCELNFDCAAAACLSP
jgi:hypothetical protein